MHAWYEAAESDKLYLIIRGDLIFDERELPKVDWDNQSMTPPLTRIDGYISGMQLGRNGFQRLYQGPVTLEIACYGPWCAELRVGQTYVVFLEMREQELVISTNPCGGFAFVTNALLEQDLAACMRGDRCDTPEQ